MTTISILRNALKLNAAAINVKQHRVTYLREEAKAWKKQGELSFFVATCADVRKHKAKLAKLVAMQKRIKVEIAAIYRNERIARKYVVVFGMLPVQQLTTSMEQEAMLDRLLAEREEQNEVVAVIA